MLIPSFRFHLQHTILPGLATIGKYDGEHPCLTCGTTGGKVFMHMPHIKHVVTEDGASDIRFLSINQEVTALRAGKLKQSSDRDLLLIGTPASLQAYDVHENADVFFKDVPDGVNDIVLTPIEGVVRDSEGAEKQLAVVGGNCSVQGFDEQGNEVYWTVSGDNVMALAICDVTGNGRPDLLVGSDDYEIRAYRGDEVIAETTESNPVTHLVAVGEQMYAFALANGTVGVYEGNKRLWRHKSKHEVTALAVFDLDADGKVELIVGWSHGKIEVRSTLVGDVIYKDTFSAPISAILTDDYRGDGREEVVVCAHNGEVRGYLPIEAEVDQSIVEASLGLSSDTDESALNELQQRRNELLAELKKYEDYIKRAKEQKKDTKDMLPTSTIPADATIDISLEYDVSEPNSPPKLLLVLGTNDPSLLIYGVILTAEQVFGENNESHFTRPPKAEPRVVINIIPPAKIVGAEIKIQALVGTRSSQHYHAFELVTTLPKFHAFMPVPASTLKGVGPQSHVRFIMTDRAARVVLWLKQAFVLADSIADTLNQDAYVDAHFISMRDEAGSLLRVEFDQNKQMLTIHTDDLEAAGEVVQDLCKFMQIKDLDSMADYPIVMQDISDLMQLVREYNGVRMRMTADMAEQCNFVKTMIVKAEDARLLAHMGDLKAALLEIRRGNQSLIDDHMKRANNQAELMRCLRSLNVYIQQGSRLRVGTGQKRMIAACRQAIKAKSSEALLRVFAKGNPQ